jgi:hypothetical protein
MTRREWFMQLGAGVVLAGWSASDLDAAELPPGVYEPSRDHLSHALAGHGLAAGSETELVQARTAFFKPNDYRAIMQLTALLLGETPDAQIVSEVAIWIDLTVGESATVRKAALALAPGHRTLAVHYYGAKAVQELEELDPQTICREGLAGSSKDFIHPAPAWRNWGAATPISTRLRRVAVSSKIIASACGAPASPP